MHKSVSCKKDCAPGVGRNLLRVESISDIGITNFRNRYIYDL